MSAINPEIRDLQAEVADLRDRMAKVEARTEQISRIAISATRQTIWQFVIFTVTISAVLVACISYQTEALRREFNARFQVLKTRMDQTDQRMDERFKAVDRRFDEMNRRIGNRFDQMEARFEDLKEAVLARRR